MFITYSWDVKKINYLINFCNFLRFKNTFNYCNTKIVSKCGCRIISEFLNISCQEKNVLEYLKKLFTFFHQKHLFEKNILKNYNFVLQLI